jgi:hypothetical protein
MSALDKHCRSIGTSRRYPLRSLAVCTVDPSAVAWR